MKIGREMLLLDVNAKLFFVLCLDEKKAVWRRFEPGTDDGTALLSAASNNNNSCVLLRLGNQVLNKSTDSELVQKYSIERDRPDLRSVTTTTLHRGLFSTRDVATRDRCGYIGKLHSVKTILMGDELFVFDYGMTATLERFAGKSIPTNKEEVTLQNKFLCIIALNLQTLEWRDVVLDSNWVLGNRFTEIGI